MPSQNHHFVSRAFLKSFAHQNGKEYYIKMYDFSSGEIVEPNIKNIATKKNFNTVELDGIDPYQVEQVLSEFEQCIPEIAALVDSTESFAEWESEKREQLFFLMGLFASKNPFVRYTLETHQKKVILESLNQITLNKERFLALFRESGLEGELDWKFLRELIENDSIAVELNQTGSVGLELQMASNLSNLLASRKWSWLRAEQGGSPFITADRPIAIDWIEPEKIPAFFRGSPGFGCSGTVVTFPVTRKTCLVGAFESEPWWDRPPKEVVPALNATIISHANRQIFFPKEGFEFDTENGVQSSDDLRKISSAANG